MSITMNMELAFDILEKYPSLPHHMFPHHMFPHHMFPRLYNEKFF